jgi:hypothetical protein
MLRDVDHFGASDAWAMFALWMWTAGHHMVAAFSWTICIVICARPDPKPKTAAPGMGMRDQQ